MHSNRRLMKQVAGGRCHCREVDRRHPAVTALKAWPRFCFLLPNQAPVSAALSSPHPVLYFTFFCSLLFLVACGLDQKTNRVHQMRALLGGCALGAVTSRGADGLFHTFRLPLAWAVLGKLF